MATIFSPGIHTAAGHAPCGVMMHWVRMAQSRGCAVVAFLGWCAIIDTVPAAARRVGGGLPMSALLRHSSYGKSQVRLTKVTRHAGHHDLKELCVAIQLEGDFDASYTHGDNSRIIATDTMKNTVYVLARNHPLADIETFGLTLARHFLENFSHVSVSTIRLAEQP